MSSRRLLIRLGSETWTVSQTDQEIFTNAVRTAGNLELADKVTFGKFGFACARVIMEIKI
jgi:hypothetical protein